MTNKYSNDQEHQQPEQPNNKPTVLKAVLIGFAVGVMFIVSAKMVNMVIS